MNQTAGSAFVLGPSEGRSIDLGNFVMSVKATTIETGAAFTLLEATEPAGFGPPMHIHHDAAEAFYVLAGEYVIFLEDREFKCPAGSFIYIPVGMRHGFRVGEVPSRKLNLYSPAAMVGYFDDLSVAITAGEADATGLDAIAPGDRPAERARPGRSGRPAGCVPSSEPVGDSTRIPIRDLKVGGRQSTRSDHPMSTMSQMMPIWQRSTPSGRLDRGSQAVGAGGRDGR